MKKVTINAAVFNRAVKQVKNSIATDSNRPVLNFIKAEVNEKTVKFVACNGYALTITEIKHDNERVEPFEFLFKPFEVYVDKKAELQIGIELIENGDIMFEFFNKDFSVIKKVVKQGFVSEYINYNEIMGNNKQYEIVKIAFDKNLLINTIKNIDGRIILLEVPRSTEYYGGSTSIKPIFINSTENIIVNTTSMVFPVRLFKDVRQ